MLCKNFLLLANQLHELVVTSGGLPGAGALITKELLQQPGAQFGIIDLEENVWAFGQQQLVKLATRASISIDWNWEG